MVAKPLGKTSFKGALAQRTIFSCRNVMISIKWKMWYRLNSVETSDTQEKRFELKTDARAEWHHDCPYWIFPPNCREVHTCFIKEISLTWPTKGLQFLYPPPPQGVFISALHYLIQYKCCRNILVQLTFLVATHSVHWLRHPLNYFPW
jgi:hypothetical protein